MAFVLGITGGIGTGKSTVLKMFGELGAETLSADDIAREVLVKGNPTYNDIVAEFGESILRENGEIDRPLLASIVFNNPVARDKLENITHPRIIKQIERHIDQFRKSSSMDAILAVEIPLLIECGLEGIVDEVLLVAAEQETQVRRLTSSRGMTVEEVNARIAAQMPLSQKIECADRVIWNDSTLEMLRQSVNTIWSEIRLL